MKQLVKLNKRPSRDGRKFIYFLRYDGEDGKRKCETLGHTNQRKAERQVDPYRCLHEGGKQLKAAVQ